MKHFPLVLICDPDPEKFKTDEHYFRQIEGVPVTVARVANLEEFASALDVLVQQGNYPDVLVVNANMRDIHKNIIQEYIQKHKKARDGDQIEKSLPSQIIFYSPRLENDTLPPQAFQYTRGQLREWFETQHDQPEIHLSYSFEHNLTSDICLELSDLYKDRSRRQAINWNEKPIDKKPVIVFCNDSLNYLSNRHFRTREAWGDNVEIILASSYAGFRSQLVDMVDQGNFPDFFTADASLKKEVAHMILFMTRTYIEASKNGKIAKPWPKHIYVHSANTDYSERALPGLLRLREMLPDELQQEYKVAVGDYTPDYEIESALYGIYPNIQSVSPDYLVERVPPEELMRSNSTKGIRSHLEYFYYDVLPKIKTDVSPESGMFCQSGMGSLTSGYVAYTLEDIERIEETRRNVSSVYSQDTVLIVKKFDEKVHGPLLPRIKGIVICDPYFEPHIQIALQNFGISALVGADFSKIQEGLPATYDREGWDELTPITLDTNSKMISPYHYRERLESIHSFVSERRISAIKDKLRQYPLLTTGIKIQAEHYTQSGTLFADETDGIGLIRSESLIRGDSHHYETAIGALLSSEDGLLIEAWRNAQFTAFSQLLKARKYETPVCYRLADFGTGEFLPQSAIRQLQSEFSATLLPQGVQLALIKPQIYKGQLRAAFNAAHNHRVKSLEILIPQVETADDVLFVKKMAEEVLAEEDQKSPLSYSVGSMIETNAALDSIIEIDSVSDFLSVGMNDLVRLNQGISRAWSDRQEHIADYGFDPYHQPPSHILGKVSTAVQKIRGKDIRLCGEFASTVDGLLFAHDNEMTYVVVTPNQSCIDTNRLIVEELLWRRNSGVKVSPFLGSDPLHDLCVEMAIKLE